jgi:hypothetical protein
MGFGPDDFRVIGVEPRLITDLKDAASGGATPQTIAALLSEKDVKTCFIAGDAHECGEQLTELLSELEPLQFGQLAFAKLGPDYEEAITLLKEVCDL